MDTPPEIFSFLIISENVFDYRFFSLFMQKNSSGFTAGGVFSILCVFLSISLYHTAFKCFIHCWWQFWCIFIWYNRWFFRVHNFLHLLFCRLLLFINSKCFDHNKASSLIPLPAWPRSTECFLSVNTTNRTSPTHPPILFCTMFKIIHFYVILILKYICCSFEWYLMFFLIDQILSLIPLKFQLITLLLFSKYIIHGIFRLVK